MAGDFVMLDVLDAVTSLAWWLGVFTYTIYFTAFILFVVIPLTFWTWFVLYIYLNPSKDAELYGRPKTLLH